MKSSTLGIGIALLCVAIGGGTWGYSNGYFDHLIPQANAEDGDEAVDLASVEEVDMDESDVLPEPFPLNPAPSYYAQVSYRTEVSKPENAAGDTIRGQTPAPVARRLPKGNPLRDENAEAAGVTEPQAITRPAGSRSAPPAPPAVRENPIAQAGLQAESDFHASGASPFDVFPAPPASSEESLLDSAGFGPGPAASPFPVAAGPIDDASEPLPTAPDRSPFPPEPLPPPAAPFAPIEPVAPVEPAPLGTPFDMTGTLSHADPFDGPAPTTLTPRESGAAAHPPVASRRTVADDRAFDLPATPQPSFNEPLPPSSLSSLPSRSPRSPRSASEGTGTPGPSILEGAQTPHLTIEKVLPPEIIVDQPTTVKTVIKNAGRSTARNIVVADRIPQGARLISTSPEAVPNELGELTWSLGDLDMNEQLIVEMRIVPYREGEIGSVAVVNYSAEASARIAVTRPMLKVDVKVPQEVHRGQTANLEITISNPGTATATGIVLEEYVPEGLYHKDGKVLVNKNIDTLKPREAKKLILPLTCTGSGNLVNRLVVKADGGLEVEEKTILRALSPVLKLEIQGAKQRFLERPSSFRLIVGNTGTASAQNVDLVAKLPDAMKFVKTNQSGVYEEKTHTVHWALEELPPQEEGEIELVVQPIRIGDHTVTFTGEGQNNLKAEDAKTVTIDGLPAISFEVVGDSNLVEVGKEITYEVRVANKGTKPAENVRVRANLSSGMSFVKAEGPRYQEREGVVQFEPLLQLEAKGEKVYRVKARCLADGEHRISVQVISDDLQTPITKEESTRVFQ